jgi:quinoprotein glucose dehydrogenase
MKYSELNFGWRSVFVLVAMIGASVATYATGGGLRISEPYTLLPAQENAPPTRSIWDGVYTKEQARRGRTPYLKLCAECHATNLRGTEDSPALIGRAFMRLWNGTTLDELFEITRVTMPVANPESLSGQVVADMVAYMLQGNKVPPGDSPLDPDLDVLRQIRIEAAPE